MQPVACYVHTDINAKMALCKEMNLRNIALYEHNLILNTSLAVIIIINLHLNTSPTVIIVINYVKHYSDLKKRMVEHLICMM